MTTATTIRCCASPDERHAMYCITRAPARVTQTQSTGNFGAWADEEVIRSMHAQADLCVRVMAMPEAERRAPGKKGAASPEQAAVLNAVIAERLQKEAQRRGLI